LAPLGAGVLRGHVAAVAVEPGLGAIFAFIISFSDINLALFLSGPRSTSRPVHIFSEIQWQGDPTIAAASSMQSHYWAADPGHAADLPSTRLGVSASHQFVAGSRQEKADSNSQSR
jgi:hypothetical protein